LIYVANVAPRFWNHTF